MKTLAFITLLAFAGSTVAQTYDATKNLRKSVTITWEVVDDVNKACAAEYAKYGHKLPYIMTACAVWEGKKCKIITKKRPSEADVGHEVMHCFQEHFH
jgi:hypothetical protein